MINFIGLRRYFAVISLIVLVPSLVALALWQLNPGIDFEGGLEIEVRFLENVPQESVETALSDASLEDATVSTTREETFAITLPVPEDLDTGQFETDVTDALTAALGEFEQPELATTDGILETEIWNYAF